LFEFFQSFHFFFLFSLNWLFVCVLLIHSSRGRLRTGGWSLLAVMSDWQCGVDWLLAEYCRCKLHLYFRWCRWRVGTKDLCLVGSMRSGEISRLSSRDPMASGVKCRPHGGKKSKMKSWTGAGVG
jgi:hypothetical protein